MPKRIGSHELEAIRQMRDDAREIVGELFPKAQIELHMATFDGVAGLEARIRDTAPYDSADIVYCLGELGVQRLTDLRPE